jgi:hypothetical protein
MLWWCDFHRFLPHVVKPTSRIPMDIRDYPRSMMPDALCCLVFISHRRWTMRELRLG